MNKLNLRYGIEDKPSLGKLLLFGVQWLAVALPMIIIVGKVVATLQYEDPLQQMIYIQKVFFIIGLSIVLQITHGHRLPIIVGPASVLLVTITANQGHGISTIYTSILLGGLILAVLSISGLFTYLKDLFTPNVVVTILMLIGFTLTPNILRFIFSPSLPSSPLFNLVFFLVMITCMFIGNRFLKGFLKSTLIVWAMLIGSLVYFALFPNLAVLPAQSGGFISGFFQDFNTTFSLDISTLVSFLICFIALAINDLGSIQAIGGMLQADQISKRISKGITLTGLLNMLSGLFGVVGPVNYSVSPGVIASTGVASRYTLIPAGIGLMLMAFIPSAIQVIGLIPAVVIGSTFTYVLSSQLGAGMLLAFNTIKEFKLENGLVIGLPLLLSVLISFIPEPALASFPLWIKPILANGFVVGVIAVFVLEHGIYRQQKVTIR